MHTLKSIASHKHIIMKSATKACLLISIFTAAICLSACERSVDPQEVSRVMLPAEHELTIRSSPTLALSPDGDMLVYRADTGEDDIRQLYLYSLIENRGRILEGTRDGETPFFSPDGDRIGFFADDKLKTISIDNGQVEILADAVVATGGYWDQDNNISYAAGAIMRVSADGGQARQLITITGNEQYAWPSVLPDGQHVMYNLANPDNQTTSIIIENLNSGEQWKVIENGSYPRFLPGGYLVYSDRGILNTLKIDLENKLVESDPQTVLTDVLTSPSTGAAQYALSDTGRLVYAPGTVFGKSRRLVMIDAEGNESDTGLPPDRYSYVKFAPDGQQLAIEIEGDTPSIWIFGIDNGRLEKIVSNATYPVWSPDSDKIAYSDISSGGTAIYQVDVRQAQDIQKIIEADLPLDHSYAWSPDGGHFAYTLLNRDSGMDIMIIQLSETATPRPLIVSFFNECCPAFSSDGRWLAYVSDMTGRPEVHIVSFPGLEETHQISKGGAREPVWSHRENIIYFWEDRQMMMADLDNTFDLNNVEPVSLIEGIFVSSNSTWRSRYGVNPQGNGFALLRRGAEETGITELMQLTDINELISR